MTMTNYWPPELETRYQLLRWLLRDNPTTYSVRREYIRHLYRLHRERVAANPHHMPI